MTTLKDVKDSTTLLLKVINDYETTTDKAEAMDLLMTLQEASEEVQRKINEWLSL